jgi:hypothetical protein
MSRLSQKFLDEYALFIKNNTKRKRKAMLCFVSICQTNEQAWVTSLDYCKKKIRKKYKYNKKQSRKTLLSEIEHLERKLTGSKYAEQFSLTNRLRNYK